MLVVTKDVEAKFISDSKPMSLDSLKNRGGTKTKQHPSKILGVSR